jgi:glutaredoxin 3
MAKKIKIYTLETCPHCHKTKDFFNENDVEFTDIDVSQNQEAAKEMVEKSGQMGVPVIDIEGKIIIGFNEPVIREALNLK